MFAPLAVKVNVLLALLAYNPLLYVISDDVKVMDPTVLPDEPRLRLSPEKVATAA
jgi:hypothetical protein